MPIQLEIKKTKVPIKIWASDIENQALDQACDLANFMPVHNHMALMADAHGGLAMPIGGVLPLIDAISVQSVGTDIGCGMCAVKTNRTEISMGDLKKIYGLIREEIPVGFDHRKHEKGWDGWEKMPQLEILKREKESAKKQLASLGGGNHFVSAHIGSDGFIWFMLHSGSRNLGYKTEAYYQKLAMGKGVVPEGNKNLAYFSMHSPEGLEYWDAMNFCLDFAFANRMGMMNIIQESAHSVLDIKFEPIINIHHNYASLEDHYGKAVYVHRKGATRAAIDTIGIIPGSMGTNSYIVKGLGNPESFQSCSHGAGRTMSRGRAKKEITKEMYLESLRSAGLEASEREMYIDEAPAAYKNIETVMANQIDLVETMVTLKPYLLPAIKG